MNFFHDSTFVIYGSGWLIFFFANHRFHTLRNPIGLVFLSHSPPSPHLRRETFPSMHQSPSELTYFALNLLRQLNGEEISDSFFTIFSPRRQSFWGYFNVYLGFGLLLLTCFPLLSLRKFTKKFERFWRCLPPTLLSLFSVPREGKSKRIHGERDEGFFQRALFFEVKGLLWFHLVWIWKVWISIFYKKKIIHSWLDF